MNRAGSPTFLVVVGAAAPDGGVVHTSRRMGWNDFWTMADAWGRRLGARGWRWERCRGGAAFVRPGDDAATLWLLIG